MINIPSTVERTFNQYVIDNLQNLDGEEFERLCRVLFELIVQCPIIYKGQNLEGKPVRKAVDISTENRRSIAQCGTEKDYFTSRTKPIQDADFVAQNCPLCQNLYLFSNRVATDMQFNGLKEDLANKNYAFTSDVYDAQRIACLIFDNINYSKIDDVLSYLPLAKQVYYYFPRHFIMPKLCPSAVDRHNVVEKISSQLENNNIVQIYGISGLGKTEVAKQVVLSQTHNFSMYYWIDGTNGIDVTNVLSPIGSCSINLAQILSEWKVLLVIDNLQTNVADVVEVFTRYNKLNSKCIITTQKYSEAANIAHYKLELLSVDETFALIDSYNTNITIEQKRALFKSTQGYPLVINMACACVRGGEISWESLLSSESSLVSLEDDKNVQIFTRVLKPVIDKYKNALDSVCRFENTMIATDYLKTRIGEIQYDTLSKYAIFSPVNEDTTYVHQVVLDSIVQTIAPHIERSETEAVCAYLDKNKDLRPIKFYTLLLQNRAYIDHCYDLADLQNKKIILYALLQVIDKRLISVSLKQKLDALIQDNHYSYYDCLLAVEKTDIDYPSKRDTNWQEEIHRRIDFLEDYLKNVKDIESKLNLQHHLGKLYSRINQNGDAIRFFEIVLKDNHKAYSSIYQIAQIYHFSKDYSKAAKYYEQILSADLTEVPLSVALACYTRIAKKEYQILAQKYVLTENSLFLAIVERMLCIDANQAIESVSSWCYVLEYRMPHLLKKILMLIPLALPQSNHYDYMAYINAIRYRLISKDDPNAVMVFKVAESNFKNIKEVSDYHRKRWFELYLDAKELDKAEHMMPQFEKQDDAFVLQDFAKYYALREDYPNAYNCINKAIESMNDNDYKSSFLWNKASFMFLQKNPECFAVLEEAIRLRADNIPEEWLAAREQWFLELV